MYDLGSPYPAIPFGPNPNHPLNRGGLAWWLAAPGYMGGGSWYEQFRQTANGLSGFTAQAWFGASQRWGRLALDGSASFLGLDSNTQSVISNRVWTWAAWIATTTTTTNSTFIGEGNGGNANPLFQFAMDQGTGNFAGLVWRDTAGNVVTQPGTVTVNDGKWHHVVGTSDGTTMSLYVDGKLDTTSTVTGVGATSLDRETIGCLRRAANSNFWAGSIDDIRNWLRCLSDREVTALYLESLAGYPEALLYWRPASQAVYPAGDPVFPYSISMAVP